MGLGLGGAHSKFYCPYIVDGSAEAERAGIFALRAQEPH